MNDLDVIMLLQIVNLLVGVAAMFGVYTSWKNT